MDELGIIGGYFSPVHPQHLMIARWAQFRKNLFKVLVIPSGQPPHAKTHYLDGELRFKMVCLATAGDPYLEPSRIEIDRPGVTWTIDTLYALKAQYGPSVRLNFICGEDNIKALVDYDRRDEFLSLCRLLVAWRGSDGEEKLAQWRAALPGADIELIDCPASDLSSSLIRELIRTGKPYRYLVSDAVYQFIEYHQLYRDVPKQPALSCPHRAAHSVSGSELKTISTRRQLLIATVQRVERAYKAALSAFKRWTPDF